MAGEPSTKKGEQASKSMDCYLHICPQPGEGQSGGEFGLPELTLAYQKAVLERFNPDSDLYVYGRTPEETVDRVNQSIDTKWVGERGIEYYKKGIRVKTHPIPQFVDLATATTLQHNHKPPKGPGGKSCVVFLVEGIEIEDEHELERVASELARLWVGVYGPCVEQSLLERRFPTPECCPNPNCMEQLCTGFHLRVLSIPNQQLVAAAFIEKLKEDLNADKPVIKNGALHITRWLRYASEVLGMETGYAPVVPDFEGQLLQLRDSVASSTAAAAAAGARVDAVARHIGKRVEVAEERLGAVEIATRGAEKRLDAVEVVANDAHQRINFIMGDLGAALLRMQAMDAELKATLLRVDQQLAATMSCMLPPPGAIVPPGAMMVHFPSPTPGSMLGSMPYATPSGYSRSIAHGAWSQPGPMVTCEICGVTPSKLIVIGEVRKCERCACRQ